MWVKLYATNVTKTYPSGKYETVNVRIASGVMQYSCGARRARVLCPIDSSVAAVTRNAIGKTFNVRCMGVPWTPVPEISTTEAEAP